MFDVQVCINIIVYIHNMLVTQQGHIYYYNAIQYIVELIMIIMIS